MMKIIFSKLTIMASLMFILAFAGCAFDDEDKLGTPGGVTAEATSSTTIMLRWKAADGAKGYRVYYNSTDADAHYNCTAGCNYSSRIQGTVFEDTHLSPGKTYYYKVTALKWKDGEYETDGTYKSAKEIESSKSQYVSVTTPSE